MSTCQKVDIFFLSSGHKNHSFITTVLSFFIIFAVSLNKIIVNDIM